MKLTDRQRDALGALTFPDWGDPRGLLGPRKNTLDSLVSLGLAEERLRTPGSYEWRLTLKGVRQTQTVQD